MASGDLVVKEQNVYTGSGARVFSVTAGTPIYAGEPVQILLGAPGTVFPAITSTPVVATSFYAGVASTNSTNTTTAAGTVWVTPINSAIDYLITPDVAATWDTQSEYDALVGSHVLLKNSVTVTATPTSGTYTILASDGATSGCVVQNLDVFKYPGKVSFAFRSGVNYLT